MTTRKFTCPSVPGAKRSSENHVYTHCVIGQLDLAAMRAAYASKSWAKTDKENHAYLVRKATSNDYRFQSEASIVGDKAFAAMSVEEYLAAKLAERLSHIEKTWGAGDLSSFGVLQWSRSLANAQKAVSAHAKGHQRNVRVVPALEV